MFLQGRASSPQRLSALYQYHNAPEVAPAHGLEYDDNVTHPISDKYPVTGQHSVLESSNSTLHRYTGKHAYQDDNLPPRIIFGMKVKTFLLVAALTFVAIVGAAIGGAVGGKSLRHDRNTESTLNDMSGTSQNSSNSNPSSMYITTTPTFTPLHDCKGTTDTTYRSSYASNPPNASADAGLVFSMHCGVDNPFASHSIEHIAQAFVYSFTDCAEICAGHNTNNHNSNCTVAVYSWQGTRPSNCWVGSAEGLQAATPQPRSSVDAAFLKV